MSSREELLALMRVTAAPTLIPITTKQWGTIYIKPPTVEEVDETTDADEAKRAEDAKAGKKDKRRFARSAARLICDKEGDRIFDADNAADVELLAKQPWMLLQKVLAAVQEVAEGK